MTESHENAYQVNDVFLLREEHVKELVDRSHDVDEACYSFDESLLLEPEDSRTVSMISVHAGQLQSPGYASGLVADDWPLNHKAFLESLCLGAPVRSLPNHECPYNSDDSLTLPMEMSPSSEQILPDFDRLLSSTSEEVAEESDQDVIQACHQLIQAGYKPNEIYAELNQRGFSGLVYDVTAEEDVDITFDGIDEDLPWTPEERRGVIDMMQMGAQCSEKSCNYPKCLLGQKMISDIEADLVNGQLVNSLVTRRLLGAIVSHSSTCDDLPCTVPWCSFFYQFRELYEVEDEKCPVEKCAALQRFYRELKFIDFEEIDLKIPESSEFIQLDMTVEWPCVLYNRFHREDRRFRSEEKRAFIPPVIPKHGIDFHINGHFGRFGQIGRTALSATLPPIQLDIIQHESLESSTGLWNRLKDLRHANVARHLWTCINGNSVTVCREHFYVDGDSLESMITKVNPRRIDLVSAARFVTGLISGAIYLNEQGVFYLRWTASGIRMNYDYTSAQLSDFSSAITSSTIEDDEEVVDLVANSLPPNILPPEIYSTDDSVGYVGSCTEVWGVGCIVYHLSNGIPVHHNLRHDLPEKIRMKVKTFPPEDHINSVKIREIADILRQIFTTKDKRVSLQRLADRFRSYLTSRSNHQP